MRYDLIYKIGCKGTTKIWNMQIFLIKNSKLKIKNSKLPFGNRIVIDILSYFLDDDIAELVLYVVQHTRGVERLVRRIGLVKGVFGVDVVGEMYLDADSQFALRRIAVHGDGSLGEVVSDDGAFEFEIASLTEKLEPCLALVEVPDSLCEVVGEGGVDQRRVVREIGYGDGMGGLVVDVRAVEFIGDGAGNRAERDDR